MINTNIILIGPSAAGKSTVGPLIAGALGIPFVDLDEIRWGYHAETGYDADKARQIRHQGGMKALAAYWKPFGVHAVERLLQDYPSGHVLAFGAGNSVCEDEEQFKRVRQALASYPLVILMLPSPDIGESSRILKERIRAKEPYLSDEAVAGIGAVNDCFLEHPSNARLAKITIYTKDKSPSETCAEIIGQLQISS